MEDNCYLKKFGTTVSNLREKSNISQEKLAELSSLHRTYISSVERGQRNVSLLNIIKIAKALGVPSDELLMNIEEV